MGERLERGEVQEVDLWREVSGRIWPEGAFDHVFTASFPPIPVMIDFAAELRARGVQTAILSNTVPSHVRAMGFLDGFDPIAMSCAIGARKPEREAFQYVLDRLGLPPDEVAYIDDSAENVAAGKGPRLESPLARRQRGADPPPHPRMAQGAGLPVMTPSQCGQNGGGRRSLCPTP